MPLKKELQLLRIELRTLRQEIARFKNAWLQQKARAERLEQESQELRVRLKLLEQENKQLRMKLDSTTAHKDKLAGMIFKTNVVKKDSTDDGNRNRGGQKGHQGHGRKKPRKIDQEKLVYLTHCPDCGNKVDQTDNTYERIVEDIPLRQVLVTLYHIERQWCQHCQKEIRATPVGTLEGFRLGLGTIIWLLFHRYRLRLPLGKMVEALKEQYNLRLTEGAIQHILHQLKKRFGLKYQQIVKTIKKAPVKHSDETGWRVDGLNNWCWLFATQKAALYTIEETRGKGVPETILGQDPAGILVRDDYAAYQHLPMAQQSCWVHLLRCSKEEAQREKASKEVKILHSELKRIYQELKDIIEQPFDQKQRDKSHQYYLKGLISIQKRNYEARDAQTVQTRIKNQGANLLTALKYAGVPLTNNQAERQIRPMVVARKISGGSRSPKGAATHAVNMSIVQTILLEGKTFFSGIRQLLRPKTCQYVLERTE